MIDAPWLRERLTEELSLDPAEVASLSEETDLIGLGLDSLRVLAISDALARAGVRVHFSELMMDPTFGGWLQVIAAAENSAVTDVAPQDSAAQEEFPLATMQHAYWLGRRPDQRLGGVAAHLYVEFDGVSEDPDAFAEALRQAATELVRRHPMLRTAVLDTGTQQVLPVPDESPLQVHDLRGSTQAETQEQLDRLRTRYSHQLLDLSRAEVWKPVLSLLPGRRHRFHLDVDMVAADAMSYRQLTEDLAVLTSRALGRPAPHLTPLHVTYRDYLLGQRQALETADSPQAQRRQRDQQWWQTRLVDLPQPPGLPFIPEQRRAEPHRSTRLAATLSAAEYRSLQERAHHRCLTPAMVVATVFAQVLGRWADRSRMLLNMPLFAREPVHPEIDLVVGDFTNSVMVSAATSADSFTQAVRALSREVHTAAAHSGYTGLNVLRDLGRHQGHPVTANVVYTSGLDLGDLFSPEVRRLFGTPVHIISQGPQVDLDAQVVQFDGGMLLNWDLRRDALPPGLAEDMFSAFAGFLRRLASEDEAWDAPCTIDLPQHQRRIRAEANATWRDLPARTLHAAILEQAQRAPEALAVRWRDAGGTARTLSYEELVRQAGAVAQALRRGGVRPGDTVGLQLPRGPHQVVAVVGALLAGATYLPVGMQQPDSRRDRVLADGAAATLLTTDEISAALAAGLPALTDVVAAAAPVTPEAIAYVLFTSGSTGQPKGVEVSHAAAANTLDSIAARFDLEARPPTVLALSAYDFDLSVLDIFLPLGLGGQVVLVEEHQAVDAVAWAELVAQFRVDLLNCAPGLVGMLHEAGEPEQLACLRLLLTGGDRVPPALAQAMRRQIPGLVFVGLGGATEAAIHSTMFVVDDSLPDDVTAVPYGRPLDNVTMRVVNEDGLDAPDFVVGELWIGGRGLAQGYRGDPERTAQRFVTVAGQRWYRTGDLARYRSDGVVEILGRRDGQVKIRGFRVEPGEVEAALESLDAVEAAVVVARDGRLLAAVQPAATASGSFSAHQVREELARLLPSHMIPAGIVDVPAVPITGNGKKDRRRAAQVIEEALAEAASSSPSETATPRDALEAALSYLLGQVLGAEVNSVTADFFDLGGDSILATSYTARVREFLGVETMTVADVLECRSVRMLADRLNQLHPQTEQLQATAELLVEVAKAQTP